ncbi:MULTISPECIES: fibronectin type III-like domain-contianing protein [Pseudomonas]|uniref:fibronectin type III-like domain-contianing protein n=1 Tax=Pseudomonas TaxID=286 RepID=UPI0009BCF3C6
MGRFIRGCGRWRGRTVLRRKKQRQRSLRVHTRSCGKGINPLATGSSFTLSAGEETVQLYLRQTVASITRPVRVLRGFSKVRLARYQFTKPNARRCAHPPSAAT